jgi:hypothetical protein
MSLAQQSAKINCCLLLQKSPSDILRMLEEARGKAAKKKTQVYEWHRSFRNGRESVNDDSRCGFFDTLGTLRIYF